MVGLKRYGKWTTILAALCVAGFAGGCAFQTSDRPSEQIERDAAKEKGSPPTESRNQGEGLLEEQRKESRYDKDESGSVTGSGDSEETKAGVERPEEMRERSPEDGDTFVQQKIVVASDLHYLAEELAGNRCQSFMSTVQEGDGRVLQYGWEILDAFLDDMAEEKPDLIVLAGDLTMNGEKQSHEELAEKLELLSENDIEVAVIPGNHDINNPYARRFTTDGTVKTESITADDFRLIYSDFGYVAADSRDPASLSYLYKLDDYYWLLMLDSCQYNPVNHVGGMIRRDTYEWMEKQLETAWEEGAQVITVSHHNLLDQSGVSREFYDDCTIEHNEELVRMLYDYEVRLHLSGHLHLQHYKEDEDSGIHEIVTGSLVMAPCQYGVMKIWNNGDIVYDAKSVDVDGWAERNSYKNRDLADFKTFSQNFLSQVTYRKAILDLRKHTMERRLFFSDEKIYEMARFYAKLCVYYYGGRMFEIAGSVQDERAYKYWNEIDYVSDLSDFLRNILEDDAKDFSHLTIQY